MLYYQIPCHRPTSYKSNRLRPFFCHSVIIATSLHPHSLNEVAMKLQ